MECLLPNYAQYYTRVFQCYEKHTNQTKKDEEWLRSQTEVLLKHLPRNTKLSLLSVGSGKGNLCFISEQRLNFLVGFFVII